MRGSGQANEFVRFSLAEADKAAIKEHDLSETTALDLVHELTQQGYRISLKHDTYDDCAACFLIAPDEDEFNHGLTLAGRGSSSYKALKQALWLHYSKWSGVWPRAQEHSREYFDD